MTQYLSLFLEIKKKNLIIEFTKELDYRDQTYVDSMKQFHKDIKKI